MRLPPTVQYMRWLSYFFGRYATTTRRYVGFLPGGILFGYLKKIYVCLRLIFGSLLGQSSYFLLFAGAQTSASSPFIRWWYSCIWPVVGLITALSFSIMALLLCWWPHVWLILFLLVLVRVSWPWELWWFRRADLLKLIDVFICVAISGSGGAMALCFAATLGSLVVRFGTIFGTVVTIFCIILGSFARGVANFLVTVGITWAVE